MSMTPRECLVALGCALVVSMLALGALVYVALVVPSVAAVVLAAGFLALCVGAAGAAWRARVEALREREVDALLERFFRG